MMHGRGKSDFTPAASSWTRSCASSCPLWGWWWRRRLRWPRGRRLRWPHRQHGATHSRLWPPGGGVRPDQPTPRRIFRCSDDLHDAADFRFDTMPPAPSCRDERSGRAVAFQVLIEPHVGTSLDQHIASVALRTSSGQPVSSAIGWPSTPSR
jgi:hypothetical protein